MIFEPFDVIIFGFPYVEKARIVKRPAVVLSQYKGFGEASGIAIVAMITSALNSVWPLDIAISDLADAGLTQPCSVRMKINSASYELIEKRIGSLSLSDREVVSVNLRQLFPFL